MQARGFFFILSLSFARARPRTEKLAPKSTRFSELLWICSHALRRCNLLVSTELYYFLVSSIFFLPCCFIRCSLSHYHSFDVEIIYLSFIFSMLRRIYIELHISLFFCCEAQIRCCFLLKTRITHKYRYYSASIGALFNALNPKWDCKKCGEIWISFILDTLSGNANDWRFSREL